MRPVIFSLSYLSFWFAAPATRKKVVTQKVERLSEIDFKRLYREGIRLLIFDYDDTLAGLREPLSDEVKAFLKNHSEASPFPETRFHLAILSNRSSSHDQVKLILDDTVLYFQIGTHRKPHPEAFFPILREHSLNAQQAAMIGDRGGTDMWGAYRLGFGERILIAPYSNHTGRYQPSFLFRWIRERENALL